MNYNFIARSVIYPIKFTNRTQSADEDVDIL